MRRVEDFDTLSKSGETFRIAHRQFMVVFVGHTECWYLRWLKKGFRHCFVALRVDDHWLICDSLKNWIEFSLLTLPATFDLAAFYQGMGHTVVVGCYEHARSSQSILPEPFTCVAVVKRVIRLQSFWTMTPWQLFCLLNAKKGDWRLADQEEPVTTEAENSLRQNNS